MRSVTVEVNENSSLLNTWNEYKWGKQGDDFVVGGFDKTKLVVHDKTFESVVAVRFSELQNEKLKELLLRKRELAVVEEYKYELNALNKKYGELLKNAKGLKIKYIKDIIVT